MNMRINELADRASLATSDEVAHLERVHNRAYSLGDVAGIYNKKFAELIVAKVLDEVATRAYVSGDRAWSDDVDRQWIELEFGYGKLHDAKTFRS